MEKILSVVIPSYNVEAYLDDTLITFVDERVLGDIEVIVVDDGSKDGTAAIAEKYTERYPESFFLVSKENGGHGSTINKGIEVCHGKYYKVVDGDDWVDTEGFVQLVLALKTCEADFVVTNYYEVNDLTKEKTPRVFRYLRDSHSHSFEEAAVKGTLPMHALVIRSDILRSHHIRLDEHCFYVDVEYVLYPIPYVNSVHYLDIFVYMYRLAVATQSVSIKGFQKHMQNHIDVILHLTDFYNEYTKESTDTVKKKYIAERIARMVDDQVTIFLSFKENKANIRAHFREFDHIMREKNEAIYELAGSYRRVLRWLRKTNFRCYNILIALSNMRNR